MNPVQGLAMDELIEMQADLQQLHEQEGQFTMQQLAINGDILMEEYKLVPGKHL
jgi:hypothetical protein